MLIGYARVSKGKEQDTAAQFDALQKAGCDMIFEEHASGARWDRPELARMMDQLRVGDTVVVWKLDRLSRSLKDMLLLMEKLALKKAGFKSLTENIDTTTPSGRMMMQMLGSFAEFEREMIKERTKAGLEQARKRGVKLGKPFKLTEDQRSEIFEFLKSGQKTAADLARTFNVNRSTISRMNRQLKAGGV